MLYSVIAYKIADNTKIVQPLQGCWICSAVLLLVFNPFGIVIIKD